MIERYLMHLLNALRWYAPYYYGLPHRRADFIRLAKEYRRIVK